MLQTFDERNRDLIVNVGGRLTHRVAALDGRVERAHRRLVAVREPAAHVDDEIAVTLIE